MNKISFLFLVLFAGFVSAQGIQFNKSKFQDVLTKAKKENKLIFIDAYASWCGPCKLMAKNVFPDKSVGDYYNANFINVKMDMEKGEGRDFAQKYRVFSYPTYLFINGDGNVIMSNKGYIKPPEFIQLGKEAQDAFKNGGKLEEKIAKGTASIDELKKAISLYTSSNYPLAKKASEIYFANKTDEFTQEDINYLIPFISNKNESNFAYFTSHKEEIIKVFSEQNYSLVEQQILVSDIFLRHTDEKTGHIDDDKATLKELIEIVGENNAQNIFNRYQLSIYQNSDPKKFIDIALNYYKEEKNFNPEGILQASWIISENSTDLETIKTASQWMETLVMNKETTENTYILAKLYYLLNKKAEAKMFAKASIDLAKGRKMLLAEQLLEKLK